MLAISLFRTHWSPERDILRKKDGGLLNVLNAHSARGCCLVAAVARDGQRWGALVEDVPEGQDNFLAGRARGRGEAEIVAALHLGLDPHL